MVNNPLISVLIPVFNVELYVRQAINSITNQTYKNLEIIIVDDCSADSTYNIVKQLQESDNRIKLFRNSKNLKIAETLNYALSQASGEYIARMDGDDYSDPTKIEKQYTFLLNNPDFVLVGTNYVLVDGSELEISRTNYLSDFEKIKRIVRYESPVAHIWLTYKKIYDELGGYRMPGVEDYDFLLRIISIGYKISNLDDFLYVVKLRDGNTNSTMGLKQRKAADYAVNLYNERILSNSLYDSYTDFKFKKVISVNEIDSMKFKKSSEYFNAFLINNKSKSFKSVYFLFQSIYESPKAQVWYLYRRIRALIIKKNYSFSLLLLISLFNNITNG